MLGLRALMPKRFLPVAFVLGLLAAACATQATSTANIGFGSGKQFVPLVADAQDNVGLYPSVALTADGQPYVAYLGFPQQLAKGEVAVPRPIGAPSVPAVMLTTVHDGIWTRGAVAMEAEIQNVQVPFGPAIVPQIKSMKPENVNGTALAIDQTGGLHVAWVSDTGVWYGENMGGSSFMTAQIEKAKIKQRGPIGEPSIAVDASGTSWVAYGRTTARGQEIVVASGSGSSWSSDVVATVPLEADGRQPSRVGIALLPDGTPVVAWGTGAAVDAATKTGKGWDRTTIAPGASPSGIALAPTSNGVTASYYLGDAVDVATSANGQTWDHAEVASVGSTSSTQNGLDGRSTGVGVDGDTTYVTWWDPSTNDVRLASGSASTFKPIDLSGTTEHGEQPSLAVSDDGRVYVAWYDEVDQNLLLGMYGSVDGLSFAIQSPTPTGPVATPPASGSRGPTGECAAASNGELTVTAQGLAFDTNCIQIPAGQKVTIHFDNKDAGTQHNIAVYPSSTEVTNPLFRGDPVTGPDSTDYSVGPLKAGEYYFQCDFHPPQMNGTFKVVSGGGGGGGGAGGGGQAAGGAVTTKVTASGLKFDTNEIDLAANKATSLTFDNQDAGVQHNIAIFKSSSDLTNPLFTGDFVTGPDTVDYKMPALKPGTYYFHCDVHPVQMTGTITLSG